MPVPPAENRLKCAACQPMEFTEAAEGMVRADRQANQRRSGAPTRVLLCGASSERIGELAQFLKAFEYEPVAARTPQRALEAARAQHIQIAVWLETEMTARRRLCIDAAKELRAIEPAAESILIGSPQSSEYADAAFRAGVYNCMSWPLDYVNLARDLDFLAMEAQRRRELWLWSGPSGHDEQVAFEGITGGSLPMRAIYEDLRRLAQNNDPVLITGPVGSGKELIACALHARMEKSQRAGSAYHPLMIFRCAGVTEEKVDELFAPGGVLGSVAGNPVLAGSAAMENGGSPKNALELLGFKRPEVILMDEISDLPLAGQLKLTAWLLVNKAVRKDYPVRIIAGSRLNLEALAAQGSFHPGLLRMLKNQCIQVPALIDRLEDLPMLAEVFLNRYADEYAEDRQQTVVPEFSREAQRVLLRHDWPGNVRELKNAIRRAAMLTRNQVIQAADLGLTAPAVPPPATHSDDWHGSDGERRPVWLN